MIKNDAIVKIALKHRENKLSHAFLLETNNYKLCLEDIRELIKELLCPHAYNDNCQKCNFCQLINAGNLPSIRIINPDGASIKKNQILELKNFFQAKSIYTSLSIYIINEAQKLNTSAANTMLKFLEEPPNNIIGFFITTDTSSMLDTIKSRCQMYSVIYDIKDYTIDIHNTNFAEIIPLYVKLLESDFDACLFKNKEIINICQGRIELENFLNIIFNIYQKALNALVSKEEIDDYAYLLDNSLIILIKKLNIIQKNIQNLQYNPNMELFLDKFVIEMRQK